MSQAEAQVKLALARLDPAECGDPAHGERAALSGIRIMLQLAEQTEASARKHLDSLEHEGSWRGDAGITDDAFATMSSQGKRVASEVRGRLVTLAEVASECRRALAEHERRVAAHADALRERLASLRQAQAAARAAPSGTRSMAAPSRARSTAAPRPLPSRDAPATSSLVHDASMLARSTQDGLARIARELSRARSELQDTTRRWRTARVQCAERRGWVRAHGQCRVALPAASDEHRRINALLAQHGAAELHRRATEEPLALARALELDRLRLETGGGLLRIRDLDTAEVCFEWAPPRRSHARPSTDPSQHAPDRDALSLRLAQGDTEPCE